MRVTILSVGKIREAFYRDAIAEYAKRLSRYCKMEIIEVADERTAECASEVEEEMLRDKEAARLMRAMKEDTWLTALAIEGRKYNSMEFSNYLERLGIQGKSNITFVIGGSTGLSNQILKRADERISFSDMTFPHQLMRVILLEQIYRGYRIMSGEPYHK